jgi:hypothetical protein
LSTAKVIKDSIEKIKDSLLVLIPKSNFVAVFSNEEEFPEPLFISCTMRNKSLNSIDWTINRSGYVTYKDLKKDTCLIGSNSNILNSNSIHQRQTSNSDFNSNESLSENRSQKNINDEFEKLTIDTSCCDIENNGYYYKNYRDDKDSYLDSNGWKSYFSEVQ